MFFWSINNIFDFTDVGSIEILTSVGIVCAPTLGNKALLKIILKKHYKYKRQFEKDQQSIKSFGEQYKKNLQDILIDRSEYDALSNVSNNSVVKNKNDFFWKYKSSQ